MQSLRSWFLLFACNLMWALQFTCVKLVQDQVGALFTVWGPMTLATIMLYPLIRAERKGRQSERKISDPLIFFMLAAVGVFPAQVLVTYGTRMSLASNAALLMLTLPVCQAVIAFFLLGERMTRIRWVSFALAILGVVFCSGQSLRNFNFGAGYLLGNALVFSGVLGSAFYNSYSKKLLARYSPMELLFWTYVAELIILTPLVLAQERWVFGQIPGFTGQTWVGLALLAFFQNYLSMVLFLKALQRLDAIQAGLSTYLITVFGVPIAAIWLGERLSALAILGGILVLGSTLMITVWEERARLRFVCPPTGVEAGGKVDTH